MAGKIADAKQEVSQVLPQDAPSLARARQQFAERLRFSLLATLPATEDLLSEMAATLPEGEQLVLGRAGKADRIPALWIVPAKRNPQANATLLVHPKGIAYTLASLNDKSGLVRGILDGGGAVLAIDAFQTGSAQAPRDAAKPSFTVFNRTNDANRVQDILTAIAYLRKRSARDTVNLVGLGNSGVWTVFARALAGPALL